MFREMRRKKQILTTEEIKEILNKATSGVLALLGDDDYPYAVPLNFVYDEDKLYFHCAKSGHKIDAIQKHAKASFCIIDQDMVVPEKYTSFFKSVILFGKIEIIEDEKEKRMAIEKLAIKYAPNDDDSGRRQAINRDWKPLCMLKMSIEHISGKQAIELKRSV